MFYEALDQRSKRIIGQEFGPYYHLIEEFVELDLIPWGTTEVLQNGSFSCRFGDEQCMANQIQVKLH